MSTKPITPEQAEEARLLCIPESVFTVINVLIVENLDMVSKSATFTLQLLKERLMIEHNGEVKDLWLDFEPLYRKAGWHVAFDKPAYHESYAANFTFKQKKD